MTALSQITENRKVWSRKPLVFQHTIFRFCLEKASLRQSRNTGGMQAPAEAMDCRRATSAQRWSRKREIVHPVQALDLSSEPTSATGSLLRSSPGLIARAIVARPAAHLPPLSVRYPCAPPAIVTCMTPPSPYSHCRTRRRVYSVIRP